MVDGGGIATVGERRWEASSRLGRSAERLGGSTTLARPASERSAMLTYLTLDLFDCTWALQHPSLRDARLHAALEAALGGDDSREHVTVLLASACGHRALARVPMVPAYPVARRLASEYAEQQALHIDLDEVT